ncbi:Uncharacterized protein PHPALM_9979 [Phytophthora palmivora]|uniref:DUF659 domain-containing protein n=1 Tax=Phytophthora palmivora TaxID=4796 RepID=A0A2P4Y5W9_9STRA|nr:Uncharacterized protein PHPALM_9979 [Phytophthora palmivora]
MFSCKPSRRQLSGHLLDTVYAREKDRVVSLLRDASYLAIVSDGWTSNNGDSIVNFVLVNPRFPAVFWKSINSAAKQIEETVGRKLISSPVTDNAPNMAKSRKVIMTKHRDLACAGCAAHGMNLIVSDAKSLARIFKDRAGLWSRFGERQSQLRRSCDKRYRLSLPVATRRCTHVKCIRNVVNNKDIMVALSSSYNLKARYEVVLRNRKIAGVLLHTAPELPTNGGGTPIFREVT